MDEIVVAYWRAVGAQFGDDALDLQGVPQDNGVREQTETTGTWRDRRGRPGRRPDLVEATKCRLTRVVLAAAHLDSDPTSNRLANLKGRKNGGGNLQPDRRLAR